MELCDVTLREGNQMPGRDYSVQERIRAGQALDRLGIPIIQASFPVVGEDHVEVIQELSQRVEARLCGLARAVERDVEKVLDSNAEVIDLIAPVSDRQLEYLVGKPRATIMKNMRSCVDLAHAEGLIVHLTLIDAFRTDWQYLRPVFEEFEDVPVIGVADSVGCRTPRFVRDFFSRIQQEGRDLSGVGYHCHDDLGVATANALEALNLGVGKVDVSVASLGERAGNISLEELVVSARLEQGEDFGLNLNELVPVCYEVLEALGEDVPPRKAILGEEVHRHESGMHTAPMLDDPGIFEAYDPTRFGGERRLLFGKGTGRAGASKLLKRAGLTPDTDLVERFLDELARKGPLSTEEAVDLAGTLSGNT